MRLLSALVAGLLFGMGLTISQMINPAKVLAFLNLAGIADGTWDPSLALVMVGAIVIAAPAFAYARTRRRSYLGTEIQIPSRRTIDPALLGGAALFGLGWGMVGFCPGPALAALAFPNGKVVAFVAAMLVGMLTYRVTMERA